MKFIHCADLHLDSKMETNLSSVQARGRKEEILLTFEKMVAYAKSHDVKGIIIAGDMFDSSRISSKTRKRIMDIILSNGNIDFLYLPGNHDEENFTLQLESIPENLKIFSTNWNSYSYDNITITGIVLTSINSSSIYDSLSLNPENINIVVLHGQTSKYNNKDHSELINIVNLRNKNIDYLALGHIHSYAQEKLDKRGVYCYSGCLEGRGFDECGSKGFVEITIDNNILTSNFVRFAKREFIEFVFKLDGYDNWYNIEQEIMKQTSSLNPNNLIKVILEGKYPIQLDKQLSLLTKQLNDIFYFAKVKDNSTLKIELSDYENDKSLKGEFIRQVMNSNLSEIEKENIIIVGLKALDGEDLAQ